MRIARISLYLCLFAIAIAPQVRAQGVGSCEPAIGEANLDINNVRARILNNGNLFWRGNPAVYEVPQGGGVSALFASGIWIGGVIDGQLRLAGATYGPYEFWAGPLDGTNPPTNCSDFDTVWKVSKEDVVAYNGTGAATPDLRTWPTGLGAPTLDADGNEIILRADGTLDHVDRDGNVVSSEVLSFSERGSRTINLGGGERPLILGDQMLWWIMNDRGNVHATTGGLPIGLEVHGSAFAFNTAGAIGNTTFYKYRMFYKGESPLRDTYMGLFSDPDLGNAFDDYVGSDTTLGVGFVYNADNDDESGGYGTAPPAVGYDFFQGPLVDDDGRDNDADGEIDEAGERLKMTAFVFYNNDGSVTGDPQTAEEYYGYMRARWRDGQRITLGGSGRDFSEIPTNFMFPGDPAANEFWSEVNSDGAGTAIEPTDRRFVMATGPFTIQPGDVQEIVYGIIWSRGTDNLNSVTKMKEDDALAQAVFDIDFQLPAPPNAPRVTATPLDEKVILTWENRPSDNNFLESYRAIDPLLSEDVEDNDYVFEGYRVFQYESPQDQEGRLLANYDVVNGITRVIEGTDLTFVTAEGTDAGVQHFHTVDGLTNYNEYFFGVQAYAYNAESGQKVYAGPVQRINAIPTKANARQGGTLLSAEAERAAFAGGLLAECLEVEGEFDICATKDGAGGGFVAAEVVNPAAVTGHDYRVEFFEHCVEVPDEAHKTSAALVESERRDVVAAAKSAAAQECFTTYDIIDVTTGAKVFDGRAAANVTHAGAPQGDRVQVFDGLAFTISGPPKAFLDIDQVDDAGNTLTSLDFSLSADPSLGDRRFFITAQGAGAPGAILGRIDWLGNVAASAPAEFEMRFVENPEVNGQIGFDYLAGPGDPFQMQGWKDGPELAEDGTYAENTHGDGRLPFQVWRLDPVSGEEVQVHVLILDDNGDAYWGLNPAFAEFTYGNGAATYERIYATDIPYDEENLEEEWQKTFDQFPASYTFGRVLFTPFGGHANIPAPGTNVRFVTSKPNLPGDVFTFATSEFGVTTGNQQVAEDALDLIGIVPNPYKGASQYEVNQLNDLVRFTNLPQLATIRVFTLSGTLIRTMQKNSPVAYFEWDLTTEEELPIASGVYLVHVEVPNVGERVLKFAVVKKRKQLNTF